MHILNVVAKRRKTPARELVHLHVFVMYSLKGSLHMRQWGPHCERIMGMLRLMHIRGEMERMMRT